MKKSYKRRKKLIKPGLQLRVIGAFFGAACIAVVVSMIMLNRAVLTISDKVTVDEAALAAEWGGILMSNLLVTCACLVPILLGIGTLVTFRIAGPLYRFEVFLKQVAAGENPEPCSIRAGDELHDFCELLNTVTEPLRRREGADADVDGGDVREAA